MLRTSSAVVATRHFDVGYSIDLSATRRLVPASAMALSPAASSIVVSDPFLSIHLPSVDVDGFPASASARIFAFGAVCIRIHVPVASSDMEGFSTLAMPLALILESSVHFEASLEALLHQVASSITRPVRSRAVEDYTVFRLDTTAPGFAPDLAGSSPQLPFLLLGEIKPVTAEAYASLVSPRYGYYPDELAIFSWDRAVVAAPGMDETDIEILLQWANAQLLELRVYDEALDDRVSRMYGASSATPRRLLSRQDSLVDRVQRDIADISDTIERVENSVKFTDDIYLSRIFAGILDVFRVRSWRSSVDRKLRLMHDTAVLLNEGAASRRSEALEITVVVLIVIEVILALVRP